MSKAKISTMVKKKGSTLVENPWIRSKVPKNIFIEAKTFFHLCPTWGCARKCGGGFKVIFSSLLSILINFHSTAIVPSMKHQKLCLCRMNYYMVEIHSPQYWRFTLIREKASDGVSWPTVSPKISSWYLVSGISKDIPAPDLIVRSLAAK